MAKPQELSRRERQIMDILFAEGEATVKVIQAKLPDAPTEMAIRRLLQILEEKGLLRRRKVGRAVAYSPKQSRERAGVSALKHVLETFFGGQVDQALAAHLSSKEEISPAELKRLQKLIREARDRDESK